MEHVDGGLVSGSDRFNSLAQPLGALMLTRGSLAQGADGDTLGAQCAHFLGYEDATLRTGEDGIGVKVPQVRDSETPYRSKLTEFLAGNTAALDRLVVEMYARGLSTRDIEDCSRRPDGELLISRSAVS